MLVEERTVHRVMTAAPRLDDVGWFAARQPGVLRFLEARLGTGTDACAVALDAAWRICAAFQAQDRVPPPRLTDVDLERAEGEVFAEPIACAHRGWAGRQPELCRWIVDALSMPPVPLTGSGRRAVGLVLGVIVSALDARVSGHKTI